MKYRPEIDGLRAIAVIPVILYHLNLPFVKGGYIGVDVFFVISGFLITSIILREIRESKFSIINFYERRARRILPALFLVLILSTISSWVLLPPYEFVKFHKSLFSVLFFSSNIFFWKDGDYFVTFANLKPLLHTWSLAVEEQFYLIFPFLLILIQCLSKNVRIIIILILTLLSLSLCQYSALYYKVPNFYLLPTRFWELSLGAIGAHLLNDIKITKNSRVYNTLGMIGVVLIFISIFVFDDKTPFPSLYTLVPTIGTILVILFTNENVKIGKFLANKYLVKIGILSYGAYLFHQPLISFFLYYSESELSIYSTLVILSLTFILSYLCFKFIERPFRSKTSFSRNQIFIFMGVLTLGLCTYSFIIFGYDKFPFEYKLAQKLYSSRIVTTTNMDERKFSKYRIEFLKSEPTALVLGSSRTMQVSSIYLGTEILNLSVSGASIQDQITLGVLAMKKFKPRVIYLGADPWLFNSNSGQTRFESIENDYFNAKRLISHSNSISTIYRKLNSEDTNSFALKIYEKLNLRFWEIKKIDDKPGFYSKIRFDGSRIYNKKYSKLPYNEIKEGFDDIIDYSMLKYSYSDSLYGEYSQFIDYILKNNIKVVLVFSPYHPEVYERIVNDKTYIFARNKFLQLAIEKDIPVIGSYDPFECGCNSLDFYDGMHPKDDCMNKILVKSL